MRPLNTRERRIQFFRFLALFLLAVLPVVVLVWLHGRVDHVENDFLRKQYARQRAEGEATAEHTLLVQNLVSSADELRSYVQKKSAALEKLKGDEKGELEDRLDKLIDMREVMDKKLRTQTASDSALLALSYQYHTVATKLTDVYVKACEDQQRMNDMLTEAQKDLKSKQEDLEKLQLRLDMLHANP
jgi:chromosome segregation ATPase